MEAAEFQLHFQRGRELFHQQRYFECHEEWEEIWRLSEGEGKRLLQGLIQAAVGFHHRSRGNWLGARRVWQRSLDNLRLATAALGCEPELGCLLASLESCLAAVDGAPCLPPPGLDLEQIPGLSGGPCFSLREQPA